MSATPAGSGATRRAVPSTDPATVLDRSPLSALSAGALGLLAGAAGEVAVRPGGYLAREGDEADAMYVVCSGRLELRLHQRQQDLAVASLGPGDLVGWSWLVPPHRWTFDVFAPEGAELLRLPAQVLLELSETDPSAGRDLAQVMAGVLSRRLRDSRVQMLDLFGRVGPEAP